MKAVQLTRGSAPVLCVHGFLGEPDDWRLFAHALGPAFGVSAWALPGHGGAPVDDFVDGVRALQRALRAMPAPPHLVGYSMGGRLALAAAVDANVSLTSLTIISASPGLKTGLERDTRARADDRLADDLERQGLEAFVRTWYSQPLFASLERRPALLHDLLSRRARGTASDRADALRALTVGRQPSLWEHLPMLNTRSLFIAGANDSKYCATLARAAGLCPRARLLRVPDAGHLPHLERPDFVCASVREFLQP
ncbi:MAG: alpha/beta fold hydrolase [Kiritimatiellae bacterium]|nr:alpha/beta fold hydrolase [Kiritimatiellia bacterium]